jgi:serine/threonine protein kinase, bacterial
MARVTGPHHAAAGGRAGAPTRPSPRPRPRRQQLPSWATVWGVLAALLLSAALVAIVWNRPEVDGTPSSDAEQQETATPTVSTPGASEFPTTPTTPATSVPPVTSVPPETAPPIGSAGGDPLGLGVPMALPACEGSWVVILGSATDPASYAADVSALLSSNPEAKYALTQGTCASLRQQTAEGQQIYAVYVGPYPDQASACAVKLATGVQAYVKRMDQTTPPDQTWSC